MLDLLCCLQASLLFVTLKKLNRLEKLRIKRSRDATNEKKQGVDSFNLQLQNLLYEVHSPTFFSHGHLPEAGREIHLFTSTLS